MAHTKSTKLRKFITTLLVVVVVFQSYTLAVDRFEHQYQRGVAAGYEWGVKIGRKEGYASCPMSVI